MNGKCIRATILAALALAGGTQAGTNDVHSLDTEGYRKKALDLIRRADVPSLQVTMTSPEGVLSFCVVNDAFYAAPGRQQETRPIDEKSIYQACSISKLPLAYFAVKMAQDGRLDLDRPLHEYEPDILRHFESEQDRERAKRITAYMVLTHTTGLPNKGYTKMSFQGEPGEKSIYSGVGMYVLQEVLERLKGRTLDVFAKEELFDLLGMTHTSYVWQKEYAAHEFRGVHEVPPVVPARRGPHAGMAEEDVHGICQDSAESGRTGRQPPVQEPRMGHGRLGRVRQDQVPRREQRRVQGHGDHDPGRENHALLLLQRRHPL